METLIGTASAPPAVVTGCGVIPSMRTWESREACESCRRICDMRISSGMAFSRVASSAVLRRRKEPSTSACVAARLSCVAVISTASPSAFERCGETKPSQPTSTTSSSPVAAIMTERRPSRRSIIIDLLWSRLWLRS